MNKYRGKRDTPVHKNLSKAALVGDVVDVVWFLDNGTDVNEKDHYGNLPIHNACFSKHHNQRKIIEILLKNGADVHARTVCGIPGMHWLAVSEAPCKFNSMELFMSHGVSINVGDEIDRTPLQFALANCRQSYMDSAIRFLFSRGAEPLRCERLPDSNAIKSYYRHCYLLGVFERANHTGVPTSELKIAPEGKWKPYEEECMMDVETAKRNILIPSVSWHDFLIADDGEISQLAREQSGLYFLLKKPSNRRHYLQYGAETQFSRFLYHFAQHQLENVPPREEFPLNYECLVHLCSFLSLMDAAHLCVALNFPGQRQRQ